MKPNINLLIILFTAVALLAGCNKKEEVKEENKTSKNSDVVKITLATQKQIKLQVETAALQEISGSFNIPAKVITNQDNEAQVGSLIQGRVKKIFARVGDFVKEGQTLMTIEGLDIGTIKANFLKANSNLEYAKTNYERLKKLFGENIGSQKSLTESRTEYEKAQAEYSAEEKKIIAVGLKPQEVLSVKHSEDKSSGVLSVKAPISGVITERNVVTGQYLDASANAFKIINIQNVWIDGQIYEKDINKVNKRTDINFTSTVYPGIKFNGRVIYIGETIDPQTRTITIRGSFSNPGNKLKPQMFGELNIPLDKDTKAIAVPQESVIQEAGQSYVFIQVNDTTFRKRIITPGFSFDGKIEIREGLKEGEKLVSNGVFYLKSELKKDELEGD